MKKQRFKMSRLQSAIAGAAVLTGVAGLGFIANAAVAPAGNNITNQATVTYEDLAGNSLTALSNNVNVTVAQIYASTLEQDNLTGGSGNTAAAGSTVSFSHTITNNGNGLETYQITLANVGGSSNYQSVTAALDGSIGAACSGNNGQIDSGETTLATVAGGSIATITVPAGQKACIAIQGVIPGTATTSDIYEVDVIVNAQEDTAGTFVDAVDDLTTGNGADSLEGTNRDRTTIVTGPVLNITKSAVINASNPLQIDYTLTVQNTGATAAQDVVIFDGLPEGTTLVPASVSAPAINTVNDYVESTAFAMSESAIEAQLIAQVASITAAGDVLVDLNGDADESDAGEVALDIDLNNDGDKLDASVNGIFVFDDQLAAGAIVNVTFSVTFLASRSAGDIVENTAHVAAGSNTVESSSADVSVPQSYAIDLDEGAGDIDGDQADGSDAQTVASGPEGGIVIFNNVITNQGNGTDRMELNFINDSGAAFTGAGGTLPATPAVAGGTVCSAAFPVDSVTYWVAGGSQLTDTNSNGTVDTGPLAAGATLDIEVRIDMAAGTTGLGDYCGSMEITSAGDNTVKDYKLERLGEIVAPAVDLANDSDFTVDVPNASHDNGGDNADVHNTGDTQSIVTLNANPGDTVTFDLFIKNEGLTSESYNLSFGGQWNNAITAGLPTGWANPVFNGADTGPTPITTGTGISSTGLVPPGATTHVTVSVTVPSDVSLTTSNYVSDSDGDTTNETIDGGLTGSGATADGDGDYPIFFVITGNSTGAVDVVMDAIDVAPVNQVVVTADQTGQVEAGGTEIYTHTLSNTGNTQETVTLTVSDSNSTDFNNSTVMIDTNNDGTPDTLLAPGITVVLPSGTVTVGGTAAAPTIVTQPGDTVQFTTTVSAQTSASLGTTNTTVVTATYSTGSATTTDTTTVVSVQLSSEKTAARDADCSGGPDEAFVTTGTTATAPGECLYWQIIVDNSSTLNAFKTRMQDNLSSFTEYSAGTLESCTAEVTNAATDLQTLCTAAGGLYCLHTDAADAETCASGSNIDGDADVTPEQVNVYLGADDTNTAATEPDGSTAAGGVFGAGQKATIRFRVQLSTN